MPGPGRGGRYHHGDLRAALIDTAIEIIGERGVRGFSLAEASRRLGVASSAPYAHFADRDEFLAAVAVYGYDLFNTEFLPEMNQFPEPAERLAAIVRAYVRFAGAHRPLFEVIFMAGLDKVRHHEVKAAEKAFEQAYMSAVRALCASNVTECGDAGPGSLDAESDGLTAAVEAAAYGHAMLLFEGDYGEGDEAIEQAADRAGRATLALIEGRRLLRRQTP
jgi:AcrR family transcriptional regulator